MGTGVNAAPSAACNSHSCAASCAGRPAGGLDDPFGLARVDIGAFAIHAAAGCQDDPARAAATCSQCFEQRRGAQFVDPDIMLDAIHRLRRAGLGGKVVNRVASFEQRRIRRHLAHVEPAKRGAFGHGHAAPRRGSARRGCRSTGPRVPESEQSAGKGLADEAHPSGNGDTHGGVVLIFRQNGGEVNRRAGACVGQGRACRPPLSQQDLPTDNRAEDQVRKPGVEIMYCDRNTNTTAQTRKASKCDFRPLSMRKWKYAINARPSAPS